MPALKWTPPKTTHAVDRRRVANPIQARTLLHAVGQQRGGRRLVAFFGCLYYAALRPEEAISLAMHNLSLPKKGWGALHVERAEPYAGKEWTDSGRNRDQRPLKQRARGEVRVVPCPPALTELLHAHIAEFGVKPDGRLFVGERNGGELPTMTIGRMWRRARQAAFMPEVAASPLARTPYDLRHAAVSTWLNGGVPATTVAEWAGHGRGLAQDLRQVPRRRRRADPPARPGGPSGTTPPRTSPSRMYVPDFWAARRSALRLARCQGERVLAKVTEREPRRALAA